MMFKLQNLSKKQHLVTSQIILSNFAAEEQQGGEDEDGGEYSAPSFSTPLVLNSPPLEDHLTQNTLWPEVSKLYGHTAEVTCLCTSHDGVHIASACKASRTREIAVRVWTKEGTHPITAAEGLHNRPITSICFSPSSDFLVTTSRDCSFAILRAPEWRLAIHHKDAHTGSISTCCFWHQQQAHFNVFATCCETEGNARIWAIPVTGDSVILKATITASQATALSWAPLEASSYGVIAIGNATGSISLWYIKMDFTSNNPWELIRIIFLQPHCAPIRQLSWALDESTNSFLLGSCSEDHSVVISEIPCLPLLQMISEVDVE